MSRHRFAICLIVGSTAILPIAARAQEFGAADSLYSNGVEAYFRGCSTCAESAFSSLMSVDPNDPRAFYFRALSLMRQGREDEARSDMQVGAQIEARYPQRFDIGKTLERVQGPSRLVLEQYRNQARSAAGLNPPRGPLRAPDTAVLRERRIVPLDEFSRAGEPQSVVAPVAAPEPMIPPAAAPAAPTSDLDAAPGAVGNPFSDDSAAAPAAKPQPKAAPPKTPPQKAAAPTPPPAKAPLPPAPKSAQPKASAADADDPFK